MTIRRLSGILITTIAAMASSVAADVLKVGDPAPPIKVSKWIKGGPVNEFEKGKAYVVEFWATWCGPCKATIPHLTELAKTYPQVTIIGASISEPDDSKVEPFVAEMGDKMDYHVATDDKTSNPRGAMSEGWMSAAGVNGIPTAFVVNQEGKIAWIGYPTELDKVLKEITSGTYDMQAAIREGEIEAKERQAQALFDRDMSAKVAPSVRKKDWNAAIAGLDEVAKSHPDKSAMLLRAKVTFLVQAGRFDDAYRAADEVAALNNDDANNLNELAWFIVANKAVTQRDLDRAMKYANRAVELTGRKNGGVLDTLARIHFDKGEIEKAIAIQTEAVAVADDQMKADLTKTLEQYKAALPK